VPIAFNKAKAQQEAEKLVNQGRISQAIKQYLNLFERDPSDLTLLNTIGDLYIRDKNVSEGLRQFYRLAETYVREAFPLKAIAIYKKIVKLEPNSPDPFLRLAELYQGQRLAPEAREQYYQAAEFYQKKKENDKALETLRKALQLDVENAVARDRLVTFCEQIGREDEATQVHLDAAQLALGRGDAAAARFALKKAQQSGPNNPQVALLRARQALEAKQPEEVEAILSAIPGLPEDPAARSLLLKSYLATQQLEKAEKAALDLFHAHPEDFAPLASFVTACVQAHEFDIAFKALSPLADELLQQRNTGSLMESLRLIWSKSPHHLPTLELICRICEETRDEFALTEILEALGQAYAHSGEFEKAAQVFHRLLSRQPENEHYTVLLKQILRQQGQESAGENVEPPASATAPVAEEELAAAAPAAPPASKGGRDEKVHEALRNSDLYARYHLMNKAVAELERVLEIYPDEVEIHRRLVEICGENLPERAEQAAQALVRIYTQQGDVAGAQRFASLAGRVEGPGSEAAASEALRAPMADSETLAPLSKELEAAVPPETILASEFSRETGAEVETARKPQRQPTAHAELAFTIEEIDLSQDWQSLQARPPSASPPPQAPPEAASFNYEESRIEVEFYLENGLADEARKAVAELERKLPGDPRVAELQALVEACLDVPATEVPEQPSAQILNLSSRAAAASPLEDLLLTQAGEATTLSPLFAPEGYAVESPGRLGSSTAPYSVPQAGPASVPPTPTGGPASPLSGLLDEIDKAPGLGSAEEEDPETHYNLGVAFREMNLLDEAIGEFQKVVRGAKRDHYPPNYMQACNLLAICFMDKGMARIAIKWYSRALEAPGLDEEAILALQYDLGVAYEQAGDARNALERFTEVYGQNIDFRDVAEKVRIFQQKVS
jgi:tetratricopeptide (TPR) repeat protein